MRQRLTGECLEKLIKMRQEGKTLKEMREATGFGISRICTALNEAGCRKNIMHEIYAETEPDEKVCRYAEDRRGKIEKITAGGRQWLDISCQYL